MPRKTLQTKGNSTAACACFNEAAARCRGKRRGRWHEQLIYIASMRPRPDAAENLTPEKSTSAISSASMRPRPDAAENGEGPGNDATDHRASMRPRPDAAENAERVGIDQTANRALQ